MKRAGWLGVMALGLAAIPGFAAAPDFDFGALAPQQMPEMVGTPRDPGARASEMKSLQQRLTSAQAQKTFAAPLVVHLTNSERSWIDDTRRVERRYSVGIAKPIQQALDFTSALDLDKRSADLVWGSVRGTGRGGFTWSAAVRVPGAKAIRLHFSGVDLPRGAGLYVYNAAGQAFGPYTGRGTLGDGEIHTHTVFGDELFVQLQVSAGAGRAPRLTLAEVGAMGARFSLPSFGPRGAFDLEDIATLAKASNLCAVNANCVVNAACQSSAVVNTAKDAIAGMLFQSGGSFYICTGGLLADNVSTSVIPYFLTANHCISSAGEAASLETYFDYQTTCSNPNCTQPYNNAGDTVGATLKATSATSDFTLLQLSSAPVTADGVATYLGWLSTPVANTNNLALYRISHPSGSPQAYSEGVVDTTKGTCRRLNRGNFIYSRDTLGGTEGGSSGSPVVNAAGQVVGQLYGACGTNVNNVCDAASNATVDGAFAVSYNSISQFLSPGACAAVGASCTSNGQCCSNSCKGPTGGKTCR